VLPSTTRRGRQCWCPCITATRSRSAACYPSEGLCWILAVAPGACSPGSRGAVPTRALLAWICRNRCSKPGGGCWRRRGVADRVELRSGDITTFDGELPQRLDVVSCNFALHQLPSEELVERCLDGIYRTRERTGCGVYVFDLTRLRNARTWPAMMSLAVVPGPVFL
jgi:hypothetical protein